MIRRTGASAIRFEATLHTIDKWTIVRLPEEASAKLPSRGQVAVQGTIDGQEFQTVLEPDGCSGHWMRIDEKLQRTAAINAGDTATLESSRPETGRSRTCHRILRQLWWLPRSRSRTYGTTLRRWRAGNGFAG
jgi:Domain of unknown function (DUF1905)